MCYCVLLLGFYDQKQLLSKLFAFFKNCLYYPVHLQHTYYDAVHI